MQYEKQSKLLFLLKVFPPLEGTNLTRVPQKCCLLETLFHLSLLDQSYNVPLVWISCKCFPCRTLLLPSPASQQRHTISHECWHWQVSLYSNRVHMCCFYLTLLYHTHMLTWRKMFTSVVYTRHPCTCFCQRSTVLNILFWLEPQLRVRYYTLVVLFHNNCNQCLCMVF